MIVDCRSCGATYNISDDKIRGRRVRVRCKSCGDGIIVDGASLQADDATRVYSAGFNPSAYGEPSDEATRVIAPSMVDLRAPTQDGTMPEEPGPEEWLVNLSETDQRAMTLGQMISAYGSGVLTDDAFVWRDGMSDWLPLLEVDEIRDALGVADEATHVVRPVDLRAQAGSAGKPASALRAAPAARAAPPVAYAAPAAPPRGRTAAAPPSTVEYEEYAPPVPPPARAPLARAQARVRERPRSDLFGGIEAAGGEEELLKSSSMPLEQYEAKPTGARNESSVLFSLNSLKAGRQGPVSAPPRLNTAAPPTAADILGMTAGGGVPGLGMESTAALLAAPAVEAPTSHRQSTIPPRARMDTTPPTERKKRGGWLLPALAIVVMLGAGAAFVLYKDRIIPPSVEEARVTEGTPPSAATAPAPAPPPPATMVAAATPSAAPTPPVPSVASADLAPTAPEPPPLVPVAAAAPVPVSAAATRPAPTAKTASEPGPASPGALAAAIRPPGATGTEAPANVPPPGKASDKAGEKVTLEEEGGEEATEPEVTLPPFDTAAAKGALEAAASSAASCKKPDGPTGRGKVQVTFSPKSGRATSANVVEGAFGGTPVGGCVAKLFRAAKVPPFNGDPVSVAKSFSIPE